MLHVHSLENRTTPPGKYISSHVGDWKKIICLSLESSFMTSTLKLKTNYVFKMCFF